MKRLSCVLLSLLIVFAVYADTTYTATVGGDPVEFKLQAYKLGDPSFDVGEEKYSIIITNHVETEEQLLGKENYEYIITKDYLDGTEPIFDIVYTTNTFNKHIGFIVEISAFELNGKMISINPRISMEYKFITDESSTVEWNTLPNYHSNGDPPEYIETAEGYDVQRKNDWDGSYTPDAGIFKNKYNNKINTNKTNNDSFRLEEMLKVIKEDNIVNQKENSGSGKFIFDCYPSESAKGPVHVISRGENNITARYIHTATAKFTAKAFVSAEKPEDLLEGSYKMHVTITAVESAP